MASITTINTITRLATKNRGNTPEIIWTMRKLNELIELIDVSPVWRYQNLNIYLEYDHINDGKEVGEEPERFKRQLSDYGDHKQFGSELGRTKRLQTDDIYENILKFLRLKSKSYKSFLSNKRGLRVPSSGFQILYEATLLTDFQCL